MNGRETGALDVINAALARSGDGGFASEPHGRRREVEILRLLGEGMGTAAVAGRLHVSRATVRNHIQNIFAKLSVHSRLEVVAHAIKHGLV